MPDQPQAENAAPETAPAPVSETPAPAEVEAPASPEPSTAIPFDPAEVEEFLAKLDSTPASVAEPIPAAAPVAEAVTAEEPAGETPQAETEAETAPAEPPAPQSDDEFADLPKRIRIESESPEDKRIHLVRHRHLQATGEKISIADAIAILEREERQEAKAIADQPPVVAAPDPIAALESELAELEASILDGADAALNSRELKALDIQLTKKVAALETAKMEAKQVAAQAYSQRMSEMNRVKAEVLTEHPDLNDPSTLLGFTVAGEIAEMKLKSDPSLQLADAPRVILNRALDKIAVGISKQQGITVEQARASLGKKPSAAPAPAAVTPPAIARVTPTLLPPAAGHLQVAPGNRPAAATTVAPNLQDVLNQNLGNADFDFDAVLNLRPSTLRLG
jgi:hypothetical protein